MRAICCMLAIAALAVLSLVGAFAGCGSVDWRKVGVDEAQCLSPSIKGVLEGAADALVDAADQAIATGQGPDSKQWGAAAASIATKFGGTALVCAAEHLFGDLWALAPAGISGAMLASSDAATIPVCQALHQHHVRLEHMKYLKQVLVKKGRR